MPLGIRRLSSSLYYKSLYHFEKALGTRFQEWRWSVRHILKGQRWAQSYIEDINHPHRRFVVEKVGAYIPIKSVLEIGCNVGPNLYLLTKRFPDIHCYGIDINKNAVSQGKKWLEEQNVSTIDLAVGQADKLEKFKTKSIDIIFTDATLLYIGPDKIKNVLSEMIRIARKAVILLEFHSDSNEAHRYYDAHWIYNYPSLFKKYFPHTTVSISQLPSGAWEDTAWRTYGTFVEITWNT